MAPLGPKACHGSEQEGPEPCPLSKMGQEAQKSLT